MLRSPRIIVTSIIGALVVLLIPVPVVSVVTASATTMSPSLNTSTIYDYDADTVHVVSDNALTGSDAIPSPVSSLGPVVGLVAAKGITNEVPSTLARVVPGSTTPANLGRTGAADVFVTAALNTHSSLRRNDSPCCPSPATFKPSCSATSSNALPCRSWSPWRP